jgi:ribonuclease HI
VVKRRWNKWCVLSLEAREELEWWVEEICKWNGLEIWSPLVGLTITTDASEEGWGAWWGETRVGDEWGERELGWTSNRRELSAVLKALEVVKRGWFLEGGERFSRITVRIRSDNTTTVSCLNKCYSTSDILLNIVKKVWRLSMELGINIKAEWLPGRDNELADQLSRRGKGYALGLAMEWFILFNRFWGPFTVDCMAESITAKVPRFFAQYPDAGAAGIDAFSQPWGGENVWVFPPPGMVGKVVAHMRRSGARGVLLAPEWPSQIWWPSLIEATREWYRVAKGTKAFVIGNTGERVGLGWNLICFRVVF